MLLSIIVILVVAAIVVYLTQYLPYDTSPMALSGFPVEEITITNPTNGSVVNGLVYVANTTQEQVQGFQNATSFGDCNGFSKIHSMQCIGMIFVTPNTSSLCFWMHNTPLPLRQAWISSGGVVTYIYQAQPESDKSVCQNAQDVLETSPSSPILVVGDQVSTRQLS